MGGCGKTRLALEVGTRLREANCKTIWFVSLADISDPGLIYETIREALDLPRGDKGAFSQVAAELGRGPTLLILDNFEQLVADGARLLQPLLEQARTLTLLVTSRQPLNQAGEQSLLWFPWRHHISPTFQSACWSSRASSCS